MSSPALNIERQFIDETSTFSSSALWINFNTSISDSSKPSVRIMWYRFLLVIVIFITAVGNILVCLAIARERKLQNTTNYFLMSLAIADCLVAVLVMPMGMISEVFGHFPFPHSACIIFATMDVLCCTSSIWHMSTMSMDRYFTIRFPFRYGRNKTRRIMLWKIIAVWAISTAISSPVFVLGIVDQKNVLSNGICAPNNAAFKIYGSIFAFYIPFFIMVVTYALTMRSLRNVLVNKKKYNRERRRKQTFRPLAQIIHQYAEIVQGIRRSSVTTSKKRSIPSTTNPTTVLTNPQSSNSVATKTPFTIIATTSPTDCRGQFFSSTSNNVTFQQENPTNDLIHHNSQHLTISYVKPSASKKRRQQQSLSSTTTMNPCDMSTVYEITEYSKSTSSCQDVTALYSNSGTRRSLIVNEDLTNNDNFTTAIINEISPVDEEEPSSISDLDSKGDLHESLCLQVNRSTSTTDWILFQLICQFYRRIFPYRFRPLAIENVRSVGRYDRSTSTSSLFDWNRKDHRSASTQTPIPFSIDFIDDRPMKRRKFFLTSPSLLTNFFRQSPPTAFRSSESSTKSSLSWGQRSSNASSSNATRPIRFRRMDSEIGTDRRSRVSTSSSSLLHTNYRRPNPSSISRPKPLRRHQFQSRSAYVISNSPMIRRQFSSTTNTNSSDSSTFIPRYYPKLLPTVSQHRVRDEDIVAANERKALRVLMIIFCVFVTLWTPFFICTLISAVCDRCRERMNSTVWFSITWLGYSSSMANPFVYTIFSDVFRRAFLNILLCRSSDSISSVQVSTKFSNAKLPLYHQQQIYRRRSPNQDQSGASSPTAWHHPTMPIPPHDAIVYLNHCTSDSFR